MNPNNNPRRSESVDISDLTTDFHSLRIGETIERLKIVQIRKVTRPSHENNLPNANYCYFIIDENSSVLTVNTWALWREIRLALVKAGTVQSILRISHPAREHYIVEILKE